MKLKNVYLFPTSSPEILWPSTIVKDPIPKYEKRKENESDV